jgi:hypothetical protein
MMLPMEVERLKRAHIAWSRGPKGNPVLDVRMRGSEEIGYDDGAVRSLCPIDLKAEGLGQPVAMVGKSALLNRPRCTQLGGDMDPKDIPGYIEVVTNAIDAMQKLVDFAHAHQSNEPHLAEAELASLQNQLASLQRDQQALLDAATKAQEPIDLGY